MAIATNRADGWPQVTIVSYVNEGLTIYFFVSRLGQKYANISRDKRVSAAIGHDFSGPMEISGLSLAGEAMPVQEQPEFDRLTDKYLSRFPEFALWGRPGAAMAPIVQLTPKVISILDYSKGFGHSDLVHVSAQDIARSRMAV